MFLNNKLIEFTRSLAFRLTYWYTLTFVIFLVLALIVLYLTINSMLNIRMNGDLLEDLADYQMLLESEGINKLTSKIEREVVVLGDAGDVFLKLFDNDGGLIYRTDLSKWKGLETDKTILEKVTRSASVSTPLIETIKVPDREFPARVIVGRIDPHTVLQLGESLEEKEELLGLLLNTYTVIFCLIIPLVSMLCWFVARQAVRAIEEVSQAALDFQKGEFDRRVSVNAFGNEIQQLADTFNVMAERIRTLITEMREMIDNIAHDLRSPLTRISAIAQDGLSNTEDLIEYKRSSADILVECDRLIQLINTTLDVAEVEAGVTETVKEEVNMTALIQDACELFDPVAEEKEIELVFKLQPDCRFFGNKHYLQRILANLLDNALKYTPHGGKVNVELTSNGQDINIAVIDTGIGIPVADQHRVFERFYRCDQSRSKDGCGLGLSFVRAVVRAHGGDVSVKSEFSAGSTFTVSFPVT